MTKVQEAQIEALKKEIADLTLESKHMRALIEGEKRKRHNHLDSTIPHEAREKTEAIWEQLVLVFEESLNHIQQELQSRLTRLILLKEHIRREEGHGRK